MNDQDDTQVGTASAAEVLPLLRRRRLTRIFLLIVVPAVAAVVALFVYLSGGRYVETDNAYVKADKIPVSAEVSGSIAEVCVRENVAVKAGQPLFRLDPAPFQVTVARAQARLAQVRTELAALKASYREKRAEITIAHTRLTFALKDQRRQADLAAQNLVPIAKLDEATQAADLAAQQIAALEEDLKRIVESLGGNVDAPVERHPSYLSASAELAQAQLDLVRVEVRAPLAGTVAKPPKLGQYVVAGTTTMALVVSGEPWIEANFPETDLTYVHPGQPVEIRVDTYPRFVWRGVVESLSPATGAEFSVIPAQSATGNWVKITQRLPVRIRLESAGKEMPQLRAGLSAVVEIDTAHRRRLFGLSL